MTGISRPDRSARRPPTDSPSFACVLQHARLFLLASAIAICFAGCSRDADKPTAKGTGATQPATPLPATLKIKDKTFTIEVAASDENRTRGLMFRQSLPQDAAMVFVFPREQALSFWMRNTSIPLDIVYLNAAGRVVTIKQMQPFDESGVPADAPARFAIELNQGTAAKIGLHVGDVIELPPFVQNPPDLE